jgi:hypothetical protein
MSRVETSIAKVRFRIPEKTPGAKGEMEHTGTMLT